MEKIEVFLKNENDAESLRTELNKYKVSNLAMEEVPEEKRNSTSTAIFSPYQGVSGPGIPIVPGDLSDQDNEAQKADPKYMSHLVSFEVEEEDYKEVTSLLKKYETYILDHENKQ